MYNKEDYDNWCWNRKYELDTYRLIKKAEMDAMSNINSAKNKVLQSKEVESSISDKTALGILLAGFIIIAIVVAM